MDRWGLQWAYINALGLGNCVATVLTASGLRPGILIILMAVLILRLRFGH